MMADGGQAASSDSWAVVKQEADEEPPDITFEEIKMGVENLMAFLNEQLGEEEAPAIVDALQKALDSSTTLRVGFLGNRGVGKTTLLNRLLGFDLLPTGDLSAITASTTEIIGTESDKYLSLVYFISLEEWRSMVDEAKRDLALLRWTKEEEKEEPSVTELHAKLNGLWNPNLEDEDWSNALTQGSNGLGFDWETKEPLDLIPERFQSLLGQRNKPGIQQQEFRDLNDLKMFLVNFTHRVEGAAWPLVRKVSILGPFELLTQNGFSLMDIPGSGDGDLVMAKRYEEGRDRCDCLFYLPSTADRLFTPRTIQDCVNKQNLLCQYFGVVVSNFHRVFKSLYKRSHPSDVPEDVIRKKLLTKMSSLHSYSWQKDQFEKLNFYFLENGIESDKYQRFFETFVEKLKALAKQENNNVLKRCIEDISMALAVGRAQLGEEDQGESQRLFQQCRRALIELQNKALETFAKYEVSTPEDEAQPIADPDTHYSSLQKWFKDPTKDIPQKIGYDKIIDDLLDIEKLNELRSAIVQYIEKSRKEAKNILQEAKNGQTPLLEDLEKTLSKSHKAKRHARLVEQEVKDDIQDKLMAARESGELEGLIQTGKGCKQRMLVNLEKWYIAKRGGFEAVLDDRVRKKAVEYVKDELTQVTAIFGAELTKNQKKVFRKEQIFMLLTSEVNAELFRKWSRKDFFLLSSEPEDEDDSKLAVKKRKVEQIEEWESWKELLEKVQAEAPLLLVPEKVPGAFNARNPTKGKVSVQAEGRCRDPANATRFSFGFDNERKKGLVRTRSTDYRPRGDVKGEGRQWLTNNCFAFKQLMQKIFKKVNVRREYYEGSLELFAEIGDAVNKVVEEAYGVCFKI